MWKGFCRLLLKWMGWKSINNLMPHKKAIIIGVPHTSNLDFIISYLHYTSLGGVASVVVKKELFFCPLGFILRKMGGIPIDRSRGSRVVKLIIDEFEKRDTLHLAITPEGTRKFNKRWKAGFHTIAKATGAVVYLGFFDFGRKEIGWRDTFELTDDAQADIKRMKAYYKEKGVVGKFSGLYTYDD